MSRTESRPSSFVPVHAFSFQRQNPSSEKMPDSNPPRLAGPTGFGIWNLRLGILLGFGIWIPPEASCGVMLRHLPDSLRHTADIVLVHRFSDGRDGTSVED